MFHDVQIVKMNMGNANAYLITDGDRAILVDAGRNKKLKKLKFVLTKLKLQPEDVKLIILTHTHYDHVGSLKRFQDFTKAKILVHEAEAHNLRQGYKQFPRGTMLLSKVMSWLGRTFLNRIAHFDAVEPDIIIRDNFDLREFGFKGYVMHTPGHTNGSVCVIINNKHALVGDTLFHIFRDHLYPPFADDTDILIQSWKKLADVDCEFYYPGHGQPFKHDDLLREYSRMKARMG